MVKRIFATILTVALTLSLLTVNTFAATFADTNGHWAQSVIEKWAGTNVIVGWNGNFMPDKGITRAEMAVVFDKLMKYTVASKNTFSDLAPDFWGYNALMKANAANVFVGDGVSMRPTDNITWQELSVTACKVLGIEPVSKLTSIVDGTNDVMKGYVQALFNLGYIGTTNPNFSYKATANVTRAQVMQLLDNIVAGFYPKAGTYTGEIVGNVIVAADGTTLKDMNIKGTLIIAEGVGEGTVTLNNVKADHVIVRGGGPNSVHVQGNSKIGKITVVKNSDNTVSIKVTGNANVTEVVTQDGSVAISGAVGTVNVKGDVNVNLTGATVQTVVVSSTATVSVDKTSTVKELSVSAPETEINIAGTVTTLTTTKEATNTVIDTASTAKVTTVVAQAPGTTVMGDGAVTTIKAQANDVAVSTGGTKVEVSSGVTGVTVGNTTVSAGTTVTTNTSGTGTTTTNPGTGGGGGTTPVTNSVSVTSVVVGNASQISVTMPQLAGVTFTISGNSYTGTATADTYGTTAAGKYTLTLSSPLTANTDYTLTVAKSGYTSATRTIKWDNTDAVMAFTTFTTVPKAGDNPPYQLMSINYNRKVDLASRSITITMKTPATGETIPAGKVIWKDVVATTGTANPSAYWQWSYRDASSVFANGSLATTDQTDLDSIERDNEHLLKAGSVVTITLKGTVTETGIPEYSISQDYTITAGDVAAASYVATANETPGGLTVTPDFDATSTAGQVKFTATLATDGNKLYISKGAAGQPNLDKTADFVSTNYDEIAATGTAASAKLVRAAGTYAVVEVTAAGKPVSVGTVTVTTAHVAAVITFTSVNGKNVVSYSLGTATTGTTLAIANGGTLVLPSDTTGDIHLYNTALGAASAIPTTGFVATITAGFTANAQTVASLTWADIEEIAALLAIKYAAGTSNSITTVQLGNAKALRVVVANQTAYQTAIHGATSVTGLDTLAKIQTLVDTVNVAEAKAALTDGSVTFTSATAQPTVVLNTPVDATPIVYTFTAKTDDNATVAIAADAKSVTITRNASAGTPTVTLTITSGSVTDIQIYVITVPAGATATTAVTVAKMTAEEQAIIKIRAAAGNATQATALTEQDFTDAALTGYVLTNIAAYKAEIGTSGALADKAAIETLVAKVNAIAKISAYTTSTSSAPTVADYTDAGVTDVTEDNLDAVNAAINALTAPTDADTTSEIQAVVTKVNDALAKINAYRTATSEPTPEQTPTITDYQAVVGDTAIQTNLASYNATVKAASAGSDYTPSTLLTMVSDVNAAVTALWTTPATTLAVGSNSTAISSYVTVGDATTQTITITLPAVGTNPTAAGNDSAASRLYAKYVVNDKNNRIYLMETPAAVDKNAPNAGFTYQYNSNLVSATELGTGVLNPDLSVSNCGDYPVNLALVHITSSAIATEGNFAMLPVMYSTGIGNEGTATIESNAYTGLPTISANPAPAWSVRVGTFTRTVTSGTVRVVITYDVSETQAN